MLWGGKMVKTLSAFSKLSTADETSREKLVMQCGRPSIRDLYRIFPGFRRLPDLAWVRWEAGKRK